MHINVAIKLRPRIKQEKQMKDQWMVDGNRIKNSANSFVFDHIFGPTSSNADVYTEVIDPMIRLCRRGFNATIMVYGQSLSGKTYTMMGSDDDVGIKILAIHRLFSQEDETSNRQFIIRVGYIEIFDEVIYDLLNRRQTVNITRNSGSEIKLSNKEIIIKDVATILKLLQKGNERITQKSSAQAQRLTSSHTIFQIIIESLEVENGPVKIGRLNLVDLDRSEGAELKNEKGNRADKGLEWLGHAIAALSKGEKFRDFAKSKLTRILKDYVDSNSNIALICTVNPISLRETVATLDFAEQAKSVRTRAVCNVSHTNECILNQVRADINRLTTLKTELQSLLTSNTGKLDNEIFDKESIFLHEKDMQTEEPINFVDRKSIRVLNVRPFFSSVLGYKKYQIGETSNRGIDTQSRIQRKNMAFKWSDFYLERVGFEINLNMRRQLKYGKNLIGRSNVDIDVDICVDSLECSRKHCIISVSDNSCVLITDLKSANGTSINGVKNKGQTVELREGDVIGIVGSSSQFSTLVGNYDHTVYRLSRFTSDKIRTYHIDDDDIIELSDDDRNDDTSEYSVKMESEPPQPTVFVDVVEERYPTALCEDNQNDGATYWPVNLELEPPQPSLIVHCELLPKPSPQPAPESNAEEPSTIELSDDDNDDGTSFFPVKMELEIPQSISSVDDELPQTASHTNAEESPTIELSDDENDDVTSFFPVKMELEIPQSIISVDNELPQPNAEEPSTIELSDDGTSFFPVEMELEIPQSIISVYNELPKPNAEEPSTIELSDNDDGTSYFPVKMELETPQPSVFVDVETSTDVQSTCNYDVLAAIQNQSLINVEDTSSCFSGFAAEIVDFDLTNYIFDDATFEELDGIINTPIEEVQDESDLKLRNLDRELKIAQEQLVQVSSNYEYEKKVFEEEIRIAQKKCEVIDVLQAENEKLKLKLRTVEALVKL